MVVADDNSTPDKRHRTGSRGPRPERTLEVPQGRFELLRHPVRRRSTLRAWDAADAYALRHLATRDVAGPVGIVNDGFGALSAGLHHLRPMTVTDSAMSETAIGANLERNGLAPIEIQPEVDSLPDGLGTVVFKVPKSLGQLEEQLHRLRSRLTPQTVLLGAGMVRDIHTSTLQLLESIIGPTTTSLAERKARLIHISFDAELPPPPNPWPLTWRYGAIAVSNRGGVFSARSLDVGTRLFLEHLPTPRAASAATPGARLRVVDLGCGNGILGTAMAVDPELGMNRDIDVIFIDSSALAIDSATLTWAENLGDRPAGFHRAERMVNVVPPRSVDLVLNNPPFHDERTTGDATAWDMFVDSHTVLRRGGELRVVGNRHLGHHARLRKIFGNCETIAANRKFVLLSARQDN